MSNICWTCLNREACNEPSDCTQCADWSTSVDFAAVSMALALLESFQITVEFPDVDFVPFFAERCRQLFGGSLEPDEYSYSYDEEYWHGGFSSHEDALAEGLSDICEERSTIYTARTVRCENDEECDDGYPIDTYDVREHDVPHDDTL